MLLLSEEDIVRALPLRECMPEAIDAIEEAERANALGHTKVHQRISLGYQQGEEKRRNLVVLPAIVGDMGAAVRTYTHGGLHLGNTERGAGNRRLQGITAVYAYDDMGMIAVLEDGHLNDVRTAAPTGVAARHLSNPDATELAIIGTGELAAGQLAAVCAVRSIKRIRAYSRTPEHVTRFASAAGELLGREIVACGSGQEACDGAHIVITITTARQPVIDRAWLAPGTTVLSIASNEVDEATILASRVVTTSVERLFDPTQKLEPFMTLVGQSRYGPSDVVELGDVVVGKSAGRSSPEELVSFISTGSPHWDVAVPMAAVRRAQRMGLGTEWP